MKQVIVAVAFLLYSSVFAAAPSYNPLQKFVKLQQDDDKCTTVEAKCTNCTHVGLCIAIGMPPTEIPCGGSTPYCNDRACSSKPSSECSGGLPSSFNCPQTDGHYPDPNNCKTYHICVNKTASDYECKDNAVYSTRTHSCVRKSIQDPCSTVNCKGKSGQYSEYPANKRFAFFCLSGETTGIMAICDSNQEYDVDLNKCKAHCTQEGLLPDPDDIKNFIECTLGIGSNYIMTKRQCPNSSVTKSEFDPVTLQCVLSK